MSAEGDNREFVEEPEYEDVQMKQTVQIEYDAGRSRCQLEVTLVDNADLASRKLVQAGQLPAYLRASMSATLSRLQAATRQDLYDRRDADALAEPLDVQQAAASAWAGAFKAEHVDYAAAPTSDEEAVAFSDAYHALIHSPALNTLLQLEQSYALNVRDVVVRRDKALAKLQERHIQELDKAVQSLGTTVTDHQVNDLAAQHIDRSQMLELNFDTELRSLKDMQRRDYHEYVRTLFSDLKKGQLPQELTLASPSRSSNAPPRRTLSSSSQDSTRSAGSGWSNMFGRRSGTRKDAGGKGGNGVFPEDEDVFMSPEQDVGPPPRLEESFTVHLGTQKKSTHNLRLIAMDSLATAAEEQDESQRLATAISLYSQQLSGVVILVDDRINSYRGSKRVLANLCDQSTDFHFPELPTQLDHLQEELVDLRPAGSDGAANTSQSGAPTLEPGDFYVTNHSNLPGIHVVFHLVVDQEVSSDQISTRSSAIVGLRNILRCAFQNSIGHLTIPLLMVSELTEETTPRWCLKRAELILKCMKGFIMENSSWGDSQSHTIQFVVPREIDVELFDAFSNLLSSVFRLSNAISA